MSLLSSQANPAAELTFSLQMVHMQVLALPDTFCTLYVSNSGLASLQHRAHIGNITAGLTKSSDLVNLGLALGATGLDAPAAARQPAVLAVTCSGHRPSCT